MSLPVVLSIAGYDPSSGAGVTADIKTAAAHGCFATTCITAITVQTTERVFAVEPVHEELVRDTLYELVRDMPPAAVRIGMLGNGAGAEVGAEFLETVRPRTVVLDPVLRSTSGAALLDCRGEGVLRERILKVVDVATPNVDEAAVLSGSETLVTEQKEADFRPKMASFALEIQRLGCPAVVVTGGHLDEAADLFCSDGEQEWLIAPTIQSRATHGTGCAFAMAIACNLANGMELREAVRAAKEYVRRAMETAVPLGQGHGPMNHLFRFQSK
jgi:hydroxymethylpyrimidine/phosphomethylpyrimidine kinase